MLNQTDLMDYFTARGLHHAVALLYSKFRQVEQAFAVWSRLLRGDQLTDPQFPGLEYFCQRLASLPEDQEELLWTHADTCLQRWDMGLRKVRSGNLCCESGSARISIILLLLDPEAHRSLENIYRSS